MGDFKIFLSASDHTSDVCNIHLQDSGQVLISNWVGKPGNPGNLFLAL